MDHQTFHVVLGSGQIGTVVAERLLEQGASVRIVRRGPPGPARPGLEWRSGDMSDLAFAERAVEGAPAGAALCVYDCMNPLYNRWSELLLPLGRGALHAAAKAGAQLIALDNLYVYGRAESPMTEQSPVNPVGRKGELRRRLAEERLEAHARGDVPVAILRASDFFGPGITLTSIFSDRFFRAALRGQKVDCFGDPDQPHAYSYGPDVAQALITLAQDERALGRVWHAPTNPAESTRRLIERFSKELGQPVSIRPVPDMLLRTLGVFSSMLRENAEMTYQWKQPFALSDQAFRQTFGAEPTAWEPAVAATLEWARLQYAKRGAVGPR